MVGIRMSRHASKTATVVFVNGAPAEVAVGRARLTVMGIVDAWREWFDVLDGGPERDVWILETDSGICEVHGLRAVPGDQTQEDGERPCDQWLLCRWED